MTRKGKRFEWILIEAGKTAQLKTLRRELSRAAAGCGQNGGKCVRSKGKGSEGIGGGALHCTTILKNIKTFTVFFNPIAPCARPVCAGTSALLTRCTSCKALCGFLPS